MDNLAEVERKVEMAYGNAIWRNQTLRDRSQLGIWGLREFMNTKNMYRR